MLPTFGLVVVTDSLHKKALMNALILVAAAAVAAEAAAEAAAAAAAAAAEAGYSFFNNMCFVPLWILTCTLLFGYFTVSCDTVHVL